MVVGEETAGKEENNPSGHSYKKHMTIQNQKGMEYINAYIMTDKKPRRGKTQAAFPTNYSVGKFLIELDGSTIFVKMDSDYGPNLTQPIPV